MRPTRLKSNRRSALLRATGKSRTEGRSYKLTIAYDGTNYAGWQLQPHKKTIQQQLEQALEKIAGHPVRVHGSGRTDAGVHARAQVASVSCAINHEPSTILRALNANLAGDIRVLRVQTVDPKFHARFSAKGKEYRYQIDCGAVADPFLRAYAWHHPRPLNLPAMRNAARLLKGRHDFSALSANPLRPVENPVRTISKLTVTRHGDLLSIAVRADGFLYKMARSIVGALVKVGEGKLTVAQLRELVRAKKRTALVETAPANGLVLWKVFY
jgi:tRNA pseudouridine38-40 synthase